MPRSEAMAMLSLSEQCVLQQSHLNDGRPTLCFHTPLLRRHQLKFALRHVLQDVYDCEAVQRRPIVEPFCHVVLRVKDVNQSSSSYEKAFGMRFLRTSTYSEYKDAFKTNILFDVHGQSPLEQPRSSTRIVASLDSDAGKADGARKALEQAFQGKSNLAKKWEEEIRKRELSGGDGGSGTGSRGGGGGGSWGGGGDGDDEDMGGSFGPDEPWDWEEIGETSMATFALLILYISITHGPKQVLKKFKLLFRYIWQGFRLRKIPEEYLTAEGSGIPSDDEEYGDSDDEGAEVYDDAEDDSNRNKRAEVSTSNSRVAGIQNNGSVNDETEDDEDDDIPTPTKQQSKREDLLSKRQAEQKEKLYQLLTPKERRQQEEKK